MLYILENYRWAIIIVKCIPYHEVDVQLHIFLTSALDVDDDQLQLRLL
jgi:hypothetical protein